MSNNLSTFAELIKKATEEKKIREQLETERKEKEVAPLLSELFASVAKAKEIRQEVAVRESPLLAELQSALSDPNKFRQEKQEKKDKIVELVQDLESKASVIQTKIDEPDKKEVVTDIEKKFLKLFNRLQNDFQTLKKYVENRPMPTSGGVLGGGGSGEVRILRMDDMVKGIAPVEGDTLVWSTSLNKFELKQQTGGSTTYSDEEMPYAKRVDFITDNELYKGEAQVGTGDSSPFWRIHHVLISDDGDVSEKWVNGSSDYIFTWSDRLTYIYS